MNPEKQRKVTRQFSARPLDGPFGATFAVDEELVLLHYSGDQNELAVFARLEDVRRCSEEKPHPNPQYEMDREQFEACTEPTRF